jgi:hypothetical protein
MGDVTRLPDQEPTEARLSALALRLPALLSSEWVLAEGLPAEYRDLIPAAEEQVKAALAPVSNGEFFEAVGELIEWADLFGLAKLPADPRERGRKTGMIGRMYWQALGDLPPDLLALALKRTMSGHDVSVMPLPGEIRNHVGPELARRKLMALRLETARMFARFRNDAPVDPERAKVAAVGIAACVANMTGPKREYDQGESEDPAEFSQYRAGPVGQEQVRKPFVGFTAAEMDEARAVLTGSPRVPLPSQAAEAKGGDEP